MLRRALADERDRTTNGVGDGEGRALELEPARFDLRQIEDVVDERELMLARGQDVAQVICLLRVDVTEDLLKQYLGEPDDRVQRCAELVAHVRQEFRFVAARGLELVAPGGPLTPAPRPLPLPVGI